MPGVAAVEPVHGTLRVTVEETTSAARHFLAALSAQDVTVIGFERQRPTLEDVFLRVVDHERPRGGRVTGLGPLLGKELLEQWRTRRLVVVAVVFVAFGIVSAFLAKYAPELVKALAGDEYQIVVPPPTVRDAADQFLKNLGQAGILTAVLLAMGSVANEKERGTAALILSKRPRAARSWAPSWLESG